MPLRPFTRFCSMTCFHARKADRRAWRDTSFQPWQRCFPGQWRAICSEHTDRWHLVAREDSQLVHLPPSRPNHLPCVKERVGPVKALISSQFRDRPIQNARIRVCDHLAPLLREVLPDPHDEVLVPQRERDPETLHPLQSRWGIQGVSELWMKCGLSAKQLSLRTVSAKKHAASLGRVSG